MESIGFLHVVRLLRVMLGYLGVNSEEMQTQFKVHWIWSPGYLHTNEREWCKSSTLYTVYL